MKKYIDKSEIHFQHKTETLKLILKDKMLKSVAYEKALNEFKNVN